MKRHEVQFNAAERRLTEQIREFLLSVLDAKELEVAPHLESRLRKSAADVRVLGNCLRYGRIIELSRTMRHWRIVLRWTEHHTAHCMVFETTGSAITYWRNNARDCHYSLDLSQYRKTPFV